MKLHKCHQVFFRGHTPGHLPSCHPPLLPTRPTRSMTSTPCSLARCCFYHTGKQAAWSQGATTAPTLSLLPSVWSAASSGFQHWAFQNSGSAATAAAQSWLPFGGSPRTAARPPAASPHDRSQGPRRAARSRWARGAPVLSRVRACVKPDVSCPPPPALPKPDGQPHGQPTCKQEPEI